MKKIVFIFLFLCTLNTLCAKDNNKESTTKNVLDIAMVSVKGGKFDMGSDSGAIDRRPAHTVTLSGYSISKYEITQEQWKAVMNVNPAYFTHCDDCPVTNVSWEDVATFIQKLNQLTGKNYRLPTESEWEYAARGGDKENENHMLPYSGKRLLQTIAWYEGNSKDHPHPVGKKQPNKLMIHDMTGNVEEWCADWYAKGYGSKNDITNPKGPATGISKVVRGGSWNTEKEDLSVIRRAAYVPSAKSNYLGFRVVLDN
ncbi:MAG: formylglycine-generating enzyme family protein [Chitinophagia bacterium]|nr:formylglycine-generating enzyme family protein [Chitinophagia bacterium]